MKASDLKVSLQTIQRLLLARLLVRTKRPLSREEVVKSVSQAICPPLSAADAEEAARRALAQCERSGLVATIGAARAPARSKKQTKLQKRKQEPRPVLTPKARDLAAGWFGGPRMPVIKNWEHARQLVALSLIGRATMADKVLRVDDLAAVILAERQRVSPSVKTLPAVVDYLAWRALGVETSAAFDVDAVQRHLLQKLVPADVRVSRTTWRRMLAMRAAVATGHDADALTRALFAQRAKPEPVKKTRVAKRTRLAGPVAKRTSVAKARKTPSSPANDNTPSRVAQPSLADFAAAVRAAAHMPTVTRFHDDRAFIGSVWEHMQEDGQVAGMSLAEFKSRLIAAHRDGLLRITRADLVGAMDPDEVERSEARYQDATFHFVALEAGGSR
jgi:hypothetical protein